MMIKTSSLQPISAKPVGYRDVQGDVSDVVGYATAGRERRLSGDAPLLLWRTDGLDWSVGWEVGASEDA